MAAEFKRAPDYSVVDPTRNWYQIALANGVVYAEESPVEIIRRFQSKNGLRVDGVIGAETLSLLERMVAAAAARNPGSEDDIFAITIRDDRLRRSVSEGTWRSLIWASRDDLRAVPRVLFDGAIRLSAMNLNERTIMPPYGRFIEPAPGADLIGSRRPPVSPASPVPPAPAFQETPTAAGPIAPGRSTSALTASLLPSVQIAGLASKIRQNLPVIVLGTAALAGLGIVIWVAARDEKDSSRRSFDRDTKEYV